MIRRSGVDPDDRRGQSDDGRVSTIILRAIDVSRRGNRSDDEDAQTANCGETEVSKNGS
ncbi:unnamed protein product, partial [Nesidiocoris tenuis]